VLTAVMLAVGVIVTSGVGVVSRDMC